MRQAKVGDEIILTKTLFPDRKAGDVLQVIKLTRRGIICRHKDDDKHEYSFPNMGGKWKFKDADVSPGVYPIIYDDDGTTDVLKYAMGHFDDSFKKPDLRPTEQIYKLGETLPIDLDHEDYPDCYAVRMRSQV